MNKPLSVAIRETTESAVKVYSESGLPIDIIVYIAQDVLNICKAEAEASYKADVARMEEENESDET